MGPCDNSRYWERSVELGTSSTWDSSFRRNRTCGNGSVIFVVIYCIDFGERSAPNCAWKQDRPYHLYVSPSSSQVTSVTIWTRWDSLFEDVVEFLFGESVDLLQSFTFDGRLPPLFAPRMPPGMLVKPIGPTVFKPFCWHSESLQRIHGQVDYQVLIASNVHPSCSFEMEVENRVYFSKSHHFTCCLGHACLDNVQHLFA